ncbi:5-formyltetrahydrofolate cyclo-ligase [Phycicoccus sp. DTK01]|uniref:5-formyltetrahydrofolate cyclo-ligase n=1 Tax=Phycicoccus sp. DTK01 TaxID=2785745 RepID=UPI001A90B48A|nr:5-formyltetrahydrofolate cyclo-ligase [Phycicoccus sp. DTK01]GIL37211.1 5-formyltetrahydrofolate cyclo-ligase [Phycicoccus sp. DTK01]
MPQSPKSVRRKELRARRRTIAAERSVEADAAALARGALELLDRLGLGSGAVVLSYESVPGEPPTAALNDALVARGARVLVPDTLADLDLDWHDLADPAAARLGLDAPTRADLVLAPGLTVDADGTRMGQGGGCYDKALPRRRAGAPVVVLLHPGELDDEPLPREEHDVPVDAVLTADGLTVLRDGTLDR